MKYVITAGGTGGHIYPAMTIADELVKQGHSVLFIASSRDIDKSILKDVDTYEVRHYKMTGVDRRKSLSGLFKNIVFLFYLVITFIKVLFLFLKFKPSSVLGFGGFITYPVLTMGRLFSAKTAIHEQNSYPGLVNRTLASKVDVVFYTFDSSLKYFKNTNKLIHSSNPRGSIVKDMDIKTKENTLLLVGGSLGAQTINELGISLAKNTNYEITLICGDRFYEENKDISISNLTLLPYSDKLMELIQASELVISRGGATTLIEILYSNTLSLIIPSPNVVQNQQEINARELKDMGLLDYLNEDELKLDNVITKLNNLINNKDSYYKNISEYSTKNGCEIIIKELCNE